MEREREKAYVQMQQAYALVMQACALQPFYSVFISAAAVDTMRIPYWLPPVLLGLAALVRQQPIHLILTSLRTLSLSLSLTHTHTISFAQLHASTTSTHSSGGTSCQSYTTLDLCEASTCGSKKHCYWNYTTESCSCCSQLCSYPLKLNKILCQCFCSENNYCSGNRRMKYQTCECLCIHQECTDGKKFDGESCQCVCPENSYWDNSAMHCISDCETVSADDCEIVKSAKNTHAYCIRDGGSCRRPSCTTFYRDQMLCSISTCEETGEPCR